jgi:hypothetical protein
MRKYWKLMSIAVITIAAIGFFYIQSALAGSNYPEFKFDTLHGAEEEVEDLVLYGNYFEGSIKGDNFQITAEGIQYNRDLSYFDRLDRRDRFPELKQHQQNYKGFMRGKNSLSQLAENEKHLAYADVTSGIYSDMEFQIEVLDKELDELSEFTVDVPEEDKYSFIYIEQVHIAGENLKVVTSNRVNGSMENFSTDIHVYEFNIDEQILANDEIIVSYSEGNTDQIMTHVYTPGDGSTLQSNSYAIFILEEWETGEDEKGNYYSKFTDNNVISINMETNEHAEFELPDELFGMENTVILGESLLYFIQPVEHGLEINAYDLENEELNENWSLTIEHDIDMSMGPPVTKIQDGKMYIVSQTNEDYAEAQIFVIDVQSVELVYEGQILRLNGNTESIEHFFHVYDMTIR